MILIDSGGYSNPHFVPFQIMKLPVMGELLMSLNYRFVVEQGVKGAFHDSSFVTPDVVDNYYNVYRTEKARKIPLVVIRNLAKEPAFNGAVLNHVACPTLIIWGTDDEVIPPSNADYFKRDIPSVKVLMVPEAGHMPHVEKAGIVNRAIIEFLSTGS